MFIKPIIIFRVDGNSEIGLGHVIRCFSLAKMLHDYFKITFFCKELPLSVENLLTENNIQNFKIEKEEQFLHQLNANEIVVLDGYQFDTNYQKEIKERGCKLVCIDDLHDKHFVADLIINHSPGISKKDYNALPVTKFALGLNYALLRPSFLVQARKQRVIESIETLMICFGGSDFKNLTKLSLQVALKFNEFKKIIVVTGPAYQYNNILDEIVTENSMVDHRHDITEEKILDSFLEADLAIVPSSSILLEAISAKCKIISGTYADNQKFLYKNLLSHFTSAYNFNAAAIENAISIALKTKPLSENIIDGNSGKRIKTLFLNLITTLREANKHDCKLYFDWANDDEVRKNSISKNSIEWGNHVKWFNNKLSSDKTKMFIAELLNKPVGQIRYDFIDGQWLVDYSVANSFRGRGLGKLILKNSLTNFYDQSIKAIVKSNNLASKTVFQSLGFKQTEEKNIGSERFLIFIKEMSSNNYNKNI